MTVTANKAGGAAAEVRRRRSRLCPRPLLSCAAVKLVLQRRHRVSMQRPQRTGGLARKPRGAAHKHAACRVACLRRSSGGALGGCSQPALTAAHTEQEVGCCACSAPLGPWWRYATWPRSWPSPELHSARCSGAGESTLTCHTAAKRVEHMAFGTWPMCRRESVQIGAGGAAVGSS